jgi:hypothetical protein
MRNQKGNNIMEKELIKIKIEPIIKRKWLTKLVARSKRATCSLISSSIAFKVSNESPYSLSGVKLGFIDFNGNGYSYIPGRDFIISELKSNECKETDSIKIVFPSAGIFWADMMVWLVVPQIHNFPPAYDIEALQAPLEHTLEPARGWRNPEHKDFCRNIIPVVDIHSVRLTILTAILTILTAALVYLTGRLIIN